jgi:hypothetical protein
MKEARGSSWQSAGFLIGTALLAAGFYGLKVLDYEQLHYRCDLFSMLESTRSWLDGRPLLHEARYGNPARMHNFYILLLFAPVTVWLGAKGLFLVHAVVLWTVSAAVWRGFRRRGRGTEASWLLALLYWGPYGFWLWMNPDMGWHVETFYLPFGVLFALALTTGRTGPVVAAGAVLIITREDGPILACALHLLWYYLRHLDGRPVSSWGPKLRGALGIGGLWGGWFLLEMALLAYQNGDQPVRSTQVWLHVQRVPRTDVLRFAASTLGAGLVVWSPVVVLTALLMGRRRAAALVVLGAPLAFVMFWAGLIYYPLKEFSLSWNPRMALVWGYSVGGLLLMTHLRPAFVPRLRPVRLAVLAAVVLVLQFGALARHRQFEPFGLVAQLLRTEAMPPSPERATLAYLARHIPRSAHVALEYYYYAPFEWHRYFWLETKHVHNAPVAEPDVIIAAAPERPVPQADTLSWSLLDTARYHRRRVGALVVLTRPGYPLRLPPSR